MACATLSGGPAVLVDQAAKPILAHNLAARDAVHLGRCAGRELIKPLMRPSSVVVLDELDQHALQVPAAQDQMVIEACQERWLRRGAGRRHGDGGPGRRSGGSSGG